MSRHKIIAIVGPTASGKSALAIKIAKKFNGEIISADSRQVYRGMDIGTAKPTKKELAAIPHHLIDIKNPDQNYTVAEYKKDAIMAIKKILAKNKLPIVAGGTGLYIKALIDNLDIPEVTPDRRLRRNFELRIKKYGLKSLYDELIKIDPEAAYIIDPHNSRRIIRALEIAIKTKRPFSLQRKSGKPLFDFVEIGIKWPKSELDEHINKRVDLMVKDGLLEEVKNLIKNYGLKRQSFDAIGYREFIDFLKGKTSFNEAAELIKKNTRNYAKRQMTWFKKDKRIHWVRLDTHKKLQDIFKLCQKFLSDA